MSPLVIVLRVLIVSLVLWFVWKRRHSGESLIQNLLKRISSIILLVMSRIQPSIDSNYVQLHCMFPEWEGYDVSARAIRPDGTYLAPIQFPSSDIPFVRLHKGDFVLGATFASLRDETYVTVVSVKTVSRLTRYGNLVLLDSVGRCIINRDGNIIQNTIPQRLMGEAMNVVMMLHQGKRYEMATGGSRC